MVYQFDRGTFKVIETGEGFLKARISVAKPGVFPYFDESGNISNRVKLPDEIFSTQTLDSIKGAPLTKDHPQENGSHIFVDSKNYKKYSKGNVSEPKVVGNEIQAIATIYDAELVAEAKRRHENNEKQFESSIGFKSLIINETGIYDNKEYDAIQRQIIVNHIALVEAGRAGSDIKLHFDKRGKSMGKKWILEGGNTSNLLTYRMNDGKTDIWVDSEIHKELMTIRTENKNNRVVIDSIEKEKEELNKKITTLKAENDKAPELKEVTDKLEIAIDQAKEWEKKYSELEKKIPEMVADSATEKYALVEFAKSVDSTIAVDGLSNREIKLQIIAKGLPFKSGINTDSVTEDQIEARYDAACDLLRAKATQPDVKNSGSNQQVDAATIAEKRAALQNQFGKNQGAQ
jgi:hypothetical protein